MLAQTAVWIKSEMGFRTLAQNVIVNETEDRGDVFINGTIDMVFEKDGYVFVVDFKTDRNENPSEHRYQMSVYYKAASTLWKKNTRLFLYYLRTGNAIELTEIARGLSNDS
jgi:ATP-dependent helicase/nuclease subunit A